VTVCMFHLYDNSDPTAGTPIDSAQVRIYSEDGTTFVTMGTTDATGEVSFDIPDSTYWVRFFKTGFSFDTRQSATIDAALPNNDFDIPGDNLETLPPSAAENICRVSGYLVGAGGEPFSGATVQFLVNSDFSRIVGSRAMVASKTTARTDEWGRIEVELIQGGVYDAVIEGWDDQPLIVKVPPVQAVSFTELIWPYPARVDLGVSALFMSPEDTADVAVSVTTSSLLETPYEIFTTSVATVGAVSWVSASSSDDSVATVSLGVETLCITAVDPGVATITFAMKDTVVERRMPALSPTYSTLTVTVA